MMTVEKYYDISMELCVVEHELKCRQLHGHNDRIHLSLCMSLEIVCWVIRYIPKLWHCFFFCCSHITYSRGDLTPYACSIYLGAISNVKRLYRILPPLNYWSARTSGMDSCWLYYLLSLYWRWLRYRYTRSVYLRDTNLYVTLSCRDFFQDGLWNSYVAIAPTDHSMGNHQFFSF